MYDIYSLHTRDPWYQLSHIICSLKKIAPDNDLDLDPYLGIYPKLNPYLNVALDLDLDLNSALNLTLELDLYLRPRP